MGSVLLWAIIFTLTTVASIVLTGQRSLIGGDITPTRFLHILIDWRFLLAAALAFGSRIAFILINNALLKIPALAQTSTTITTLITSAATLAVLAANWYLLGEHLSLTQGIGAFLILFGVFLVTIH